MLFYCMFSDKLLFGCTYAFLANAFCCFLLHASLLHDFLLNEHGPELFVLYAFLLNDFLMHVFC